MRVIPDLSSRTEADLRRTCAELFDECEQDPRRSHRLALAHRIDVIVSELRHRALLSGHETVDQEHPRAVLRSAVVRAPAEDDARHVVYETVFHLCSSRCGAAIVASQRGPSQKVPEIPG